MALHFLPRLCLPKSVFVSSIDCMWCELGPVAAGIGSPQPGLARSTSSGPHSFRETDDVGESDF